MESVEATMTLTTPGFSVSHRCSTPNGHQAGYRESSNNAGSGWRRLFTLTVMHGSALSMSIVPAPCNKDTNWLRCDDLLGRESRTSHSRPTLRFAQRVGTDTSGDAHGFSRRLVPVGGRAADTGSSPTPAVDDSRPTAPVCGSPGMARETTAYRLGGSGAVGAHAEDDGAGDGDLNSRAPEPHSCACRRCCCELASLTSMPARSARRPLPYEARRYG